MPRTLWDTKSKVEKVLRRHEHGTSHQHDEHSRSEPAGPHD
jgi:hypothetical protein